MMKRVLRLFACLMLLTATVVKAETLTNDSILQLHKLGLGDSVVIQKIKASTCNFDTSMDALKSLKDAGLSDDVIQAMLLVPQGDRLGTHRRGFEKGRGETLDIPAQMFGSGRETICKTTRYETEELWRLIS